MEKIQKAEIAEKRSNIYGFLSTIFKEEVDSELLDQLRKPEFSGVLAGLGVQLDEKFWDKPEKDLLLDLAVEYTRLFLGPGKHISPHESVHKDQAGLLWGDSTVEVNKFYEKCEYGLSPKYKGIPDHITVELELMQHLARRESEALREGNGVNVNKIRRLQKRFLSKHLIKWVPAFCEKVEESAELPFYKNFAELTRLFVESEHKEV